MKSTRSVHMLPLTTAFAALLAAAPSPAASLFWDGDATTANADGGAGTWDTSASNWDDAPLAGGSAIWNNATPDSAVFPGTAGTVTLGAAITGGGLRFDTNSYIIDASAHPLALGAANNTILLAGNANATITGTVGGTGNVALGPLPTLGRTLTLNGTATGGWSGTTTVHLGSTLALAASNQALLSTSAINLNGGGIRLTNTNATEAALDRVSDSAAIAANGGTLTLTNTASTDVYAETLGPVALAVGQTGFSLATDQVGGGSQTLTLSGLTRAGVGNASGVAFAAAATSPNATTNRIIVTGAAETPTGQIAGPWATTGTSANVQTDYAVFDASAQVLPANIAATTEDTWTTASNPFTSSEVAVTLTGNRSMHALKNTGATATITLSDGASGYNLATNGILNAVNSLLTIAPGTVPGAITAPGTEGGHIYINTGGSRAFALTTNNNTIANNLSIDISAPINDNGGPVTLVKTGDTSVLRLTGTNTYSGGTVVNAGILFVSGDAALGASSGAISLNGGQLRFTTNGVTFNRDLIVGPAGGWLAPVGNQNNINFAGKLSGTGTLNMTDTSGAASRNTYFNSTENDFTGAIFIPSVATTVRVNSLVDSSGAGDIILYKGGRGDPAAFEYGTGAIAPLTLNHRSIQIINNTGTTFSSANLVNSNTTHAITVNTDLIAIGSTAKTLLLSAAAGPTNVFAGRIADATGGGTLNLTKAGAGIWALSGANSYTGATTISAGTLVVNGIANGGAPSSIGSSSSQSGGLVLAGGTLKYEPISAGGGTGSTTDRNLVIRSSSAIDASGTGALVFGQTGTVSPDVIDLTGTFTAANATVTGLSSTANLAVGMTVTSAAFTGAKTISAINSGSSIALSNGTGVAAGSFSISAGVPTARTLTLTGTNTGNNTLAGVLQNSTATGSGVLSVTKNGTGTWVLTGANTYTGNTTVNVGTLVLAGGSQTSPVTVKGGAVLGFVAGSPTTSTAAVTFEAGSKVSITGTPTPPATTLLTTTDTITGTPELASPITYYELVVEGGNTLKLNFTGGGGDYGTWAANFPGADLVDPNADYDNDGMNNDHERIFGLDPTMGSSVNPISVPFSPGAGTLSYTRRDPALTGLVYSVWTSTDLQTWTEDTGATPTPGAIVNEIQTVALQLSAGLLAEPMLFVRVKAETAPPPPPLLEAGFEDSDGGFTAAQLGTGTDWAWGDPESPNKGGGAVTTGNGNSAKCWGTDLTDAYLAGTDAVLRSPVIDLTGTTGATLSFALAIDASDGHTLEVNVIDDTTDSFIANLMPATGDLATLAANWGLVGPLALPAAAYGQPVRLEWRFRGLSGDGNYLGVYIDDVNVTKTAP